MSRPLLVSCIALVTLYTPGIRSEDIAGDARVFTEVVESKVRLTPAQRARLQGYRSLLSTADSRIVRVNFALLASQSWVELDVFGERVPMARERIEQRRSGDFSWFGRETYDGSRAILVVHDGRLTGTIHDGRPENRDLARAAYAIRYLGGDLHVALRVDDVAIPPESPPGETDDLLGPPTGGGGSPCTTFTALVAYTPAVANSEGDPIGLVQLLIDEFNDLFFTTQVNLHVNLVHTYEVNYDEYEPIGQGQNAQDQSIADLLDRFAQNGDGYMDEVHDRRDTYGADVVVLLGRYASPPFDIASGKAQEVVADADTAFAVVADGYAAGPYHFTFHHEVGHLFGLRHDPDTDSATEPFPYGHGYIHAQGDAKWRTVMSYNVEEICGAWPGCPKIPHFSNPDVDFEGVPTGDYTESDNARVLEERICDVAAFRQGVWM
jgi:Metallo-peptidase family M12